MAELSEKLNQGTISLEATQLALQDIEFGATAKPRPKAIPVSAFESERVEWIWTGRLPRGKVTILDGDPGLGKSTISLDIAAKVSRGHSFPNDIQRGQPGTALLLSAEDGIGDTIRPRLEAAGADIDKIHLLRGIPEKGDSERPVVVPNDLPLIETIIAEIGAELVILDPLMAFLGAKVDSHRDQDVRRAMHALASVAERTGAALLIIRHLNKSGGQNAVHRGGGSIGIIGSARLGLIVGKDPDNNDQRVLAITKSNIAIEAQSLAYKIVEDDTLKVAKIEWLGTTGHRANDLLNDPNPCERPAQNEAEEVLRSILQAGPLPAKEVKRLANDAGISKRTIDRAKASLKIRSVKTGAPGSAVQVWKWELPEDRPEPPNTNTVAIFSEAWRSSEEYEGISASESEDGSESGQASERENTQIL
jgi:hypothetical protein